ncbi:MAG: YncE family protein [Pseudomonadota bacterium]|jgi:virginiamycin B lyase|uniref:Vgb family protein n=1 Tax=Sphingobium sp. CECT 9361 TaxID=2845384 RepID=UPI001E3072C2|nr:YncE family protein [Sphingobium sp. CECT 9361]CAH0354833.1 Virginiamycin B lyase [Sphingobium sp. CECT 9361]
MKKPIGLMLLLGALCAADAPDPAALNEKVISVPGFADFLAVDGSTVWATNAGRVEQWSAEGKQASVTVPKPCGAMTIAFGALWVANCKDGNLYRIDPKTSTVQAIITTGIANPAGELNVVSGAGSIWVPSDKSGKIARIDPATNTVTATVSVDPGTFYLAFGFDGLWAVSSDQQSLQHVDPQTNAVVKKVKLGKQPGFLAAGEGAVWVQEQGDGTVARVDPATVTVSGRVQVGKTLIYGDIDVGGGKVWLRTTEEQTFVAIDPTSLKILARAGKPSGSGALRYTPDGIWTTAHDLHSLSWWSAASKPTH